MRNPSRQSLCVITSALGLMAGMAWPQPATATEAPDAAAIDALQQQLRERESQLQQQQRLIQDLMRRVQSLEQRVPPAPAAAAPAAPAAAAPAAPAAAAAAAPAAATATPEGEAQPQAAAEKKPPAPGMVEVDEEAAERALERTLVAGGALLLPFGQAEVEPGAVYTYRENGSDLPILATVDKIERHEVTGILGLRFGLPWDSQFELGIPYNYANQKAVLQIQGARDSQDASGHALGDVSVGLAKTVVREGKWRPDLVGRITYGADTGERFDNNVPLDGGFNRLRGSLTALKRQDPLAFVGSLSYEYIFESNDIRPGDRYSLLLNTLLAVSPETSFRFGILQTFIDDARFDGETINDSDQTQSVLQIGLSTFLGRGVLFDIVAGVGLTDSSPDYSIGVSLPIRFTLPVP